MKRGGTFEIKRKDKGKIKIKNTKLMQVGQKKAKSVQGKNISISQEKIFSEEEVGKYSFFKPIYRTARKFSDVYYVPVLIKNNC
jgi:hypothetical protein